MNAPANLNPGTRPKFASTKWWAQIFRAGAGLLFRGSSSGSVGLVPPATGADIEIILPAALPAGNGYAWTCDTDGTSQFAEISTAVTEGDALVSATASRMVIVDSSGQLDTGHGVAVSDAGQMTFPDNKKLTFGTASDATMYYDGTNMVFDSQEVGTGKFYFITEFTALCIGGSADELTIRNLGTINHTGAALRIAGGGAYPVLINSAMTIAASGTVSTTFGLSVGNGTIVAPSGVGTNVAGTNFIIKPGASTGSQTPSSFIIQSSVAGVSGSTPQTMVDTLTVTNGYVAVTGRFYSTDIRGGNAASTDAVLNIRDTTRLPVRIWSADGNPAFVMDQTGYIGINCEPVWAGPRVKINGFVYATSLGVNTTAPDKKVEINSAIGDCLRLTYNDADGSATYYSDFTVSSAGNLTIAPSGGVMSVTGDVRPTTDDTYYLGKNDDDTPAAWKGLILKDQGGTGKYYRLEIYDNAVRIVDLTD